MYSRMHTHAATACTHLHAHKRTCSHPHACARVPLQPLSHGVSMQGARRLTESTGFLGLTSSAQTQAHAASAAVRVQVRKSVSAQVWLHKCGCTSS